MRGHRNVVKRLQFARQGLSPEAERAYGWILQAVAERKPITSSYEQRGFEHQPDWQPDWGYIGRSLPRRFGPYLPWLSKQVRWWYSPAFDAAEARWRAMIDLYPRTVEQEHAMSEPELDALNRRINAELESFGLGELTAPGHSPPARMLRRTAWGRMFENRGEAADFIADRFPAIVDWAVSQSPNLGQYDLMAASDASGQWHDEIASKDGARIDWYDRGEVVYEFEDGWTLQKLNSWQLEAEGEAMGNCIGGYTDAVDQGESEIYSLRDPLNQPHVDAEWTQQEISDWYEVDEHERFMIEAQEGDILSELFEDGDLDEEDLDGASKHRERRREHLRHRRARRPPCHEHPHRDTQGLHRGARQGEQAPGEEARTPVPRGRASCHPRAERR
jgi:hypothetical protein